MSHTDITARAIQLAGGRQALADRLGITPQAISMWPQVPAKRVLAVAAATGHKVTPQQLRPDIFGEPGEAA